MPNATECFAAACAPGTVKILGVRIRPLTLGHVVLLSRVGNSLAVGGPESFDDLVSAVQICSRNWTDGLELISRPPSQFKMALWQRWCQVANGLTTGDFRPLAYAPRQWILLKRWFVDQIDPNNWPTFLSESKGTREIPSTPNEAFTLAGMMDEFSMTIEEAMNTPYALCRTLMAVNAERHGAGKCWWLESDDHIERKEYLRQQYLENLAKRGAAPATNN